MNEIPSNLREPPKEAWTPEAGRRRGLWAGGVTAVALALLIAWCWRFVALFFGSTYPIYYRVIPVAVCFGVGLGFAWMILAVCERAGGMTALAFKILSVGLTFSLAVVLAFVTLARLKVEANEEAALGDVMVMIALPFLLAAFVAGAFRSA